MASSGSQNEVFRSECTWPATPEHVREARRALTALALRAGIEEPVLDDVKLAVTEAVSNAVRHGYRGGTRGEITLVAEADDHRLDVTVRDRGYGMAPHVEGHGAGLGLPLISELSETVAVGPNPDGAGTEVRMRFRLPTAVAA